MRPDRWSAHPVRLVVHPLPLPRGLLPARLALAGLVALAAALRLAALDRPAQPGEATHMIQVYALDQLGGPLAPDSGAALAWLQTAAYTRVTGAFSRHDTALAAVREPFVLTAAASGVLLWWLARRAGLSRWAAGGALALVALSPLALAAQLGARPENLAAPWALAGVALLWTQNRHRRLAPDLWATAFLVVAVLTAPVTGALAVTAGWLVWRRRRRRLSLMLACLFAIGVGIGLGASAALTGLRLSAAGPPVPSWSILDPAPAVLGVLAAAVALASSRLRPLAAGALALLAAALVPGGPGTGAVTVLVPVAALLVAGVVECGITHSTRTGRHALVHPLRAPTIALAVVAVACTLPSWVHNHAVQPEEARNRPVTATAAAAAPASSTSTAKATPPR